VRNPLLENKNYKKLQERKFTKTKAKEIAPVPIPMPREDPKKERISSRHDATEAKKIMVQCLLPRKEGD
jgi:hypothetical protein